MANAVKLKSGSYRVQVSKVVDGKLLRRSFTDADKKTALRLAAEWQDRADAAALESANMTLREAYERYIKIKENVLSPNTVREYRRSMNADLSSVMQIKIYNLTRSQIQSAINIEAATHSPKTVRNIHGLLSAVLAMFRPDFILTTTLPQKEKKKLYIPDDSDVRRLLIAVQNTPLEIPVLLAAFGPMRRGEICALTSDDIHGCTVTVNKSMAMNAAYQWVIKSPKTYAGYREIEYPDFVAEKLSAITGQITSLTPADISDRFRTVCNRNNLPHFRFHDLRHYAVSIMHAIGVPDKYIMQRGGWASNYTMQNVYNHALRQKQDEFSSVISHHFSDVYATPPASTSHETSHEIKKIQ